MSSSVMRRRWRPVVLWCEDGVHRAVGGNEAVVVAVGRRGRGRSRRVRGAADLEGLLLAQDLPHQLLAPLWLA